MIEIKRGSKMKEKTLSDEIGFVDDFEIRDRKQTHPSSSTPILELKDVKEAVQKLKELSFTYIEEELYYEWIKEIDDKIFGENLR